MMCFVGIIPFLSIFIAYQRYVSQVMYENVFILQQLLIIMSYGSPYLNKVLIGEEFH